MAIQKQVSRGEIKRQDQQGLGVSLNALKKPSSPPSSSQAERNALEISAYAHDIKKSLLVGALIVLIEVALYYFKIIK